MTNYHLGLVEFSESFGLTSAMYFKSKFDRKVGEKLTFESKSYRVAVIGDNRNEVIRGLNSLIRFANERSKVMAKYQPILN